MENYQPSYTARNVDMIANWAVCPDAAREVAKLDEKFQEAGVEGDQILLLAQKAIGISEIRDFLEEAESVFAASASEDAVRFTIGFKIAVLEGRQSAAAAIAGNMSKKAGEKISLCHNH